MQVVSPTSISAATQNTRFAVTTKLESVRKHHSQQQPHGAAQSGMNDTITSKKSDPRSVKKDTFFASGVDDDSKNRNIGAHQIKLRNRNNARNLFQTSKNDVTTGAVLASLVCSHNKRVGDFNGKKKSIA